MTYTNGKVSELIRKALDGVPTGLSLKALSKTTRVPIGTLRRALCQPLDGVKMEGRNYVSAPRRDKTKKPCMRCHKPFNSAGPHHRLCKLCRLEAAREAYAFDLVYL